MTILPDANWLAVSRAGFDGATWVLEGGGGTASRQQIEKRPICVDLDGAVVTTDTLVEGRAALKRRIVELAGCAAELLPYNLAVRSYLHRKRQGGHLLVLATAADARFGEAIDTQAPLIPAQLRALRPHQWSKTSWSSRLIP
jgi:hypothetical protein